MAEFSTKFVRSCPVCGRPLQVPIELLGRSLTCSHCRASFLAVEESAPSETWRAASRSVLERANSLLARLEVAGSR